MRIVGGETLCSFNETRYSEPMPWIGLYVTAASIACFLAMTGDVVSGFRNRKLWIPCRFFSLNATSLILISIATKLPVDLNTLMPQLPDQLTKLSGTVLICTTMANFMPSLGTMEDSQVILNVVPLGILVITIIVNVCIEMVTGVIFTFLLEHIIILFFMLIMLLIFCSSALAVSNTKQLLRQQYELKYQQASDDEPDDRTETSTVIKLRNDVRKCWMMAHCCSPQHVLSRSTMCTASGAFCLLGALVLSVAFTRSIQMHFCYIPSGKSDYKWSTVFVFLCQFSAVWVGTVAPAWRWFNVVNSRCLEIKSWSEFKGEFKVEKYWIQRLREWKDRPLPFDIGNRRYRKILHGSRNLVLNVGLCLQIAIVLTSKSIRLVSILAVSLLKKTLFCFPCIILPRLFKTYRSVSNDEMRSSSGTEIDLRDFVLHLEGEEKLVQLIMKQGYVDTEKWICRGRKKRLIHLTDLLKKCTISEGFKGVGEFDSDRVSSVGSKEPPPNCWALTLVTLTSIAIAIPCIGQNLIESLILGVNEGLRYVRLVEKKLDLKGPENMIDAADTVWLGIDLYHRWLDVDLAVLAREDKDAKKIIEHLAEIGKNCILEFEKSAETVGEITKSTLKWPAKALAGNSLYRICKSILDDYENKFGTVEELLEWLSITISDILGACLTNLPRAISMECFSSGIEAKEDSIRKAASLLGEAENILDTLGHQAIQDLGIDQFAYIDDWRASKLKKKNPSGVPSATSNVDMSSATSGEIP
ncbi:uncharacterized protein LOC131233713 [Magnolia sinica]|uniref:uncharacterized protein LOC131233713 n=1 Tax=Magnolia sinica TaxID=86752 RepID=UPI002659B023|nr:uncharacterized protein LOC131233713 [Magnolia sinica]